MSLDFRFWWLKHIKILGADFNFLENEISKQGRTSCHKKRLWW